MSKYNFVIFNHLSDYYDIAYQDILDHSNVRYLTNVRKTSNAFLNVLFKIHFSRKVNRFICNPFKKVFNKYLFYSDFTNDKPICFVFTERTLYLYEFGFFEYLRKHYTDCKIVCFLQDLVKTIIIDNKDYKLLFSTFDLSISFDHNDCINYNLIYHQLIFSNYQIILKDNCRSSDIYFVGKAKDRLPEIIAIFEILRAFGLNCEFYLVEVDIDNQVYQNEIHYISSMPYLENLQNIKSSKCLLEIMQHGGRGYTQRMCEAIIYDKKMITNNIEVENAPFFNEKYISVFKDPKAVDATFLKSIMLEEKVDYHYKEELSPNALLSFIEQNLSKK